MGKRHLVDSNVIIDFFNGKLPVPGRRYLESVEPEISVITNVELFASKNISQQEYSLLEHFVAITFVHPVNTDLISATISIRQQYKLKLPDAIIAATAIVHDLPLLSRNAADFSKIKGLQVIDPYAL